MDEHCLILKNMATRTLNELQQDVNLLQSRINEVRRRISECRSEEDFKKIDEEIPFDEGYKHIELFD